MIFGKKEQQRQQEVLKADAESFNKELQELGNKYKLALQPAISVTQNGIIPVLNLTRMQEAQK